MHDTLEIFATLLASTSSTNSGFFTSSFQYSNVMTPAGGIYSLCPFFRIKPIKNILNKITVKDDK